MLVSSFARYFEYGEGIAASSDVCISCRGIYIAREVYAVDLEILHPTDMPDYDRYDADSLLFGRRASCTIIYELHCV